MHVLLREPIQPLQHVLKLWRVRLVAQCFRVIPLDSFRNALHLLLDKQLLLQRCLNLRLQRREIPFQHLEALSVCACDRELLVVLLDKSVPACLFLQIARLS